MKKKAATAKQEKKKGFLARRMDRWRSSVGIGGNKIRESKSQSTDDSGGAQKSMSFMGDEGREWRTIRGGLASLDLKWCSSPNEVIRKNVKRKGNGAHCFRTFFTLQVWHNLILSQGWKESRQSQKSKCFLITNNNVRCSSKEKETRKITYMWIRRTNKNRIWPY